jgi:hypothetical protein
MLLASEASVISFEPGASNLFYASSSLLRLHEQGTIAATARAALVPLGLGRNASGQLLHQAIGNAGHAVIGHKPVQFAPLGHLSPQAVRIERLDDVLWPLSQRSEPPPPIHLLSPVRFPGKPTSRRGMQAPKVVPAAPAKTSR